MTSNGKPTSGVEKARKHRERLRQRGLRPLQIWVADTRVPSFAGEDHRQSLLLAHSRSAKDDQAFIDAISELQFE